MELPSDFHHISRRKELSGETAVVLKNLLRGNLSACGSSPVVDRLVDLGLCRSRSGQALQVGAGQVGHVMHPGGWN